MSTPVTYVGTQYNVPAFQDTGWAQGSGNLSSYLIALATGSLTLAGGTFTLTADADFGANFGLKSIYYKSRAANPSSTGVIRLGNTEIVGWRDAGNTTDLELTVNASDQLTFNGVVIASSSGNILIPNGTVSAPGLAFASDTNSGLYRIGADDIAFATGGVITVEFNSSNQVVIPKTSNQLVLGVTNTTTISATAPAASRTYTLPDVGGAADFVMTAGAQTLAGVKTFSSVPVFSNGITVTTGGVTVSAGAVTISATTNQIVLGTTNTVTITSPAPAASRVLTIPDPGGAASFVMTEGAQTINGNKTVSALLATLAANMAAGGFKITGLGAGSANGDSVRWEQLQVFQYQIGSTSTAATTTSTSFSDTNLSVSITPTSSSHRILIFVFQNCGGILSVASNVVEVDLQLLRGAGVIHGPLSVCEFDTLANNAQINGVWGTFVYIDSPATTSSTTYKTQFARGNSANAVTHNVQVASGGTSYIVAIEIGA